MGNIISKGTKFRFELPQSTQENAPRALATLSNVQPAALEFFATDEGVELSLARATASREGCSEIAPGVWFCPGPPITTLSVAQAPSFVRTEPGMPLQTAQDLEAVGGVSVDIVDGYEVFTLSAR